MEMIKEIPEILDLEIGQSYHRWSLHDEYGGNRYAGITPCADHPYVFVFTGESGSEHGYKDEFRGDTFIYTGEGQEGDMEMTGGNKAVRDQKEDGREIHLFESDDEPWSVTYLGQFECIDWFCEQLPDTNENLRKAIRFKLEPADNQIELESDTLEETDLETLYNHAKTNTTGDLSETAGSRRVTVTYS